MRTRPGLPWPFKIILLGTAFGLAPVGTNLHLLAAVFILAWWMDHRRNARDEAASRVAPDDSSD